MTTATYAEQIAAAETKRAASVSAMNEIMTKAAEDQATLDEAQQDQFDELEGEIKEIDAHIKRLKTAQSLDAAKAAPVETGNARTATANRTGIQIKRQEKLEPGIAFARIAKIKGLAQVTGESPRELAKNYYGEDSSVYGVFAKAAVPAATSTDATWAGPLVGDETSAFADFVEFLRPMTILGRFGSGGIPSLRRVPFRVPLIGQTSGGDGYWVGEGKAKPLTKFDFERTTLTPTKVANIAVAAMETLRDSSPSAEAIIRDQLAEALQARMDTDFVDPDKAAVANVSPASIVNGYTLNTDLFLSSGDTADNVRQDIQSVFNAFIAANNAPTNGVWMMPSTTALALSLMQNPLGQSEFPDINMMGGSLFGLPVITSQYIPTAFEADSSGAPGVTGAVVSLVNASDIYMADEGGISVDMSREASLEMDNAPTSDSDTPTGSSVVSMFQTNSVAFLAERTLTWAKRRATGSVVSLGNVSWAP